MRPLAVFAHGVLRFVLDGVIWHNVESALPEPVGRRNASTGGADLTLFVVCQREIGEWARFGQMNVGDEVSGAPFFAVRAQ